MKRTRWKNGGAAMGIITRFICNIPSPFPAVLPLHLSLSSESLLYDLFSVLLRRIFDGMPNLPNFLCIVFSVLIFFLPFYLFFLLNFLVYNLIKY